MQKMSTIISQIGEMLSLGRSSETDGIEGESVEDTGDADGAFLHECPGCGVVYLSDESHECSKCGEMTVSIEQ